MRSRALIIQLLNLKIYSLYNFKEPLFRQPLADISVRIRVLKGFFMPDTIFEFRNVTKKFPGVVALNSIHLEIERGEIHILVGENGAGKSTLIKLLCGIFKADGGSILYNGEPYAPQKPLDAINAGVSCVYQEFNLLEYMSVAENIFFQKLPQHRGIVDYKALYADTKKLLAEVGLPDLSPKTNVEVLGIAQKQLVEIAKAVSRKCRVLILDEPTATLTPPEIEKLFVIIGKLKQQGVTIIYISHRLQEIKQIGDRLSVLRNGNYIGTWNVKDLSVDEIVSKMVGRDIDSNYPFLADSPVGNEMMRVRDLKNPTSPEGVSFSVRKGEILGVAGLIGSGRTEAMRGIFGADPIQSGSIILEGKTLHIKSPEDAVKEGICLLTEDRKKQGLVLPLSCSNNIVLTDLKQVSKRGKLIKSKEKDVSQGLVDDLAIKISSLAQAAGNLSGGNQQKVVIAKWLLRKPRVIILDEPTRGIDVNAKHEIYLLLWKMAKEGAAIIFVSSDIPELLGICHRIAVFSKGKITGIVSREDFSQEKILSLAYQEYLK